MRSFALFLIFCAPTVSGSCLLEKTSSTAVASSTIHGAPVAAKEKEWIQHKVGNMPTVGWGISYDLVETKVSQVSLLKNFTLAYPFTLKNLIESDPASIVKRLAVVQVAQKIDNSSVVSSYTLIAERGFSYFLEIKEEDEVRSARVIGVVNNDVVFKPVGDSSSFRPLVGLVDSAYEMWMLGQSSSPYYLGGVKDKRGRISRAIDNKSGYDIQFEYMGEELLPRSAHFIHPNAPSTLLSVIFYRRDLGCNSQSWSEHDLIEDAVKNWAPRH